MLKFFSKWVYKNKISSFVLIILLTLILIFFVIWVFENRIKKIEGKARSAIIQNH
ncbi:MAG TPA: hypothetical protein VHQ93_03005 [Chitinophagaceae bacterium]|nr:hypothetical protein [Chitinophagaceae bacterium]